MTEFAARQIEENKKTQSPFLDLGKCSLSDIPEEVFGMVWLERLNFGNIYFDHDAFEYKLSDNEGEANSLEKANLQRLASLPVLKGLYLSRCNVYDFMFLIELQGLLELDISYQLLPSEILGKLEHLTWLSIQGCEGDVRFISDMNTLEFLDISSHPNLDTSVLVGLKNLKHLFAHSYTINSLDFLINLPELETLNIHRSGIVNFDLIGILLKLKRLNISGNKILPDTSTSGIEKLTTTGSVNPETFAAMLQNDRLRKAENKYSKLLFVASLRSLEELNLAEIPLSDADVNILELLPLLSSLNLNNTGLTNMGSLPLHFLKKLWLQNNRIEALNFLEVAPVLEMLDVEGNTITDITPLSQLTQLKQLNISRNQINSLEPLKDLKELVAIDADENLIEDVHALEHLDKLTSLNICSNQIPELICLEPVKQLLEKPYFVFTCSNNPFLASLDVSLEAFKNHREAILSILQRQNDDTQMPLTLPVKVLLLGNHASGKTSLLHFIQTNTLKQTSTSTHVINIEHYPANKEFPDAIFFDFGGQDYYHGIYRAFLTNGALAVILWNTETNSNIAGIETSSNLPNINYNLDYWIGQKRYLERQNAASVTATSLMVVQSHAANHARSMGTEEASLVLDRFFLELKGTRAEPANTTVKQKEMEAARAFFVASLHTFIDAMQVRQTQPRWYIDFLKYILKHKQETEPHQPVTLSEVAKFYKNNDQTFIQNDLEQLHMKGLVLYYRKELPDCVWLNPEKLVQYIHEHVLSKDRLTKSNGRMPVSELANHSDHIVKLLELQKVIFRYGDEYIIPNYLPLSTADKDYELLTMGMQNTVFLLRFCSFVPFGLINQLVCFYGSQSTAVKFWRNQLLFCFNNTPRLVLITLSIEQLEIAVKCTGVLSEEEKQYIFYTILSLYWNEEPVGFSDFQSLKSLATTTTTTTPDSKISPTSVVGRLFSDATFFPVDLFISVNGREYLPYTSLIDIDANKTKVLVYPLNEGKVNRNAGAEVALNLFQAFTLTKLRKTKKLFISYSHADKPFREAAQRFLVNLERDKLIEIWQDILINPGDEWDDKIKQNLEDSDIILLLVSQDFINSSYVYEIEMKKAVEKAQNKTAMIVPFLLKSCDWKKWSVVPEASETALHADKGTMGRYQFLPLHETDKRGIVPLIEWAYAENAWMQLVDFLRGTVV